MALPGWVGAWILSELVIAAASETAASSASMQQGYTQGQALGTLARIPPPRLKFGANVTLTDRIPAWIAHMNKATEAAVEKIAREIEADAKARSRVDTGQMRDGWQAERVGSMEWVVFNPVEHAIFNEFGTVSMAAQPMLHPAVESARARIEMVVRAMLQ